MNRYRIKYREGMRFGQKGWVSPFPLATNIDPRQFKCPLPQSDAEFEVLARVIFGVPLTLAKLWVFDEFGQAQIAEPYDSFHGAAWPFSQGESAGYARLNWFMRTVFGPIRCSSSLTYTDFRYYGHRHWRRLEAWQESRRRGQSRTLRPAFVRLARNVGAGENAGLRVDHRGHGVLIAAGREDGAAHSFPKMKQEASHAV